MLALCFGGCDLGWWFLVCSPFACILLVVCSLLVCHGFAPCGYGFCLLWVWVLLGGDHGLLFFFFFFFFLGVEC